MTDTDRCWADFGEVTLDCELPAGHEGDHQATLTWPQSDPLPPSTKPLSPGWVAYLQQKYGAASR